jgi:high-affinity nickel permease
MTFLLLPLALSLGIRHGFDLDHIAAISDLAASGKTKRDSIILGMLYILGHAVVILTLGTLAILIGLQLPDWVDALMERFVGATLVGLAIWLLISIIVYGKNFRLRSSRLVIFGVLQKAIWKIKKMILHSHQEELTYIQNQVITEKTAFVIGMIHGIGAETPTQLLLFITAAGIGNNILALLFIIAFVSGLILSNLVVVLFSVSGLSKINKHPTLRVSLGLLTVIFSFWVGVRLLV